MTTKFKVGDKVAKIGTVMQVQKSDKIAPYLVQFNDGDTDWCREGKLTAIDAAPVAPMPPPTVQVNEHHFRIDHIFDVTRVEHEGEDLIRLYTTLLEPKFFPYSDPQAAAFYAWWTSNTVMRFVPDDTEADNG